MLQKITTFWELTTTFINSRIASSGLVCGAEKDGYLETLYFHFFPHYSRQRVQKRRNGRLVFSECQFSSPIIFVPAPFNTRGNSGLHSVSVCSFTKTWHRICTKFRADIEALSLIFKHHSETCLASASSNFETPLRLVECCNWSSYLLNAPFRLHMNLYCGKQTKFSISCSWKLLGNFSSYEWSHLD